MRWGRITLAAVIVVESGALFVLPVGARGQSSPIASWITTAGWAAAAENQWKRSFIITPDGVFTPDEALTRASETVDPTLRSSRGAWVPQVIITAAKDIRLWIRARRFRRMTKGGVTFSSHGSGFVWQRHVPFHTAGLALASAAGWPLVLSVHGLHVEEARHWGIRRPGWGRIMEWLGETRILRKADVIACVSNEVAQLVCARGIDGQKVVVTPNGVDLELFRPTEPDQSIRHRLGLAGDSFTVGWVGSFRTFHGLGTLLDAMQILEHRDRDATLLLVGTGPGLSQVRAEIERRDLQSVILAGSYPHDQMPRVLGLMDAAVVLGDPGASFHYSPVKVREYMAMGLPVIAARLGELERNLTEGQNALLFDPANAERLAASVERLMDDSKLRATLSDQARGWVDENGSWDATLDILIRHLEATGMVGPDSRGSPGRG